MTTRPNHLFLSSCDGALHDTRHANWAAQPLRAVFSRHHPRIESLAEFKATLRAGATTDLGGYPLFFIMADCGILSFESARSEFRNIARAMLDSRDGFGPTDKQWIPRACEVNYEDPELYCDHSNARIPSAYAEPESDSVES